MAKTKKPRCPKTRPSWALSNFDMHVKHARQNYELIGSFRRFESAWRWREFIREADPSIMAINITHHGELVNVWKRDGDRVSGVAGLGLFGSEGK